MRSLLRFGFAAALALGAGCGEDVENPGGQGGGGEGGGPVDIAESCSGACEARASLDCPSGDEGCQENCEALAEGVPWCSARAASALECLASEPSSLECSDSGLKAKEGACSVESQALLRCWCAGEGASTIPDLAAACDDFCAKTAGLPCADPACAAECEATIAQPFRFGRSALAAALLCMSKLPESSFACDEAGGLEVPDACAGALGPAIFCTFETFGCGCDEGGVCYEECKDSACSDGGVPSEACDACLKQKCL